MTGKKAPLGRAGHDLDEVLSKIRKDRDLRIASIDEVDLDVHGITTGNIAIDAITGVGGLPEGRLTELFGLPSSGKTTLALQCAARAQRSGKAVVFMDYEHGLDPEYCEALGIHPDAEGLPEGWGRFLVGQPETFEQGMNALRELIETGEIGVAIVDSVAAMVTEKELSIETGGSIFADKAKLMAQTMRQLTPIAQRYGTVIVFLNHIQDVIDASPMGQKLAASGVKRKTTPGGAALKFHSSVRMEFKQIGNVRGKRMNELTNEMDDLVVGTKVQVTCVKNKVGPPFRTTEVRMSVGKGFSQAYSVLNILVAHKIVRKGGGGNYTFPKEFPADPTRGEENVIELMEAPENEAWFAAMKARAEELIEAEGLPKRDPALEDDEDDELQEMLAP